MLYRTPPPHHHPSSSPFQFYPFLSATTPPSPSPPPPPPLLSSKVGKAEMECAAALKKSFRGESLGAFAGEEALAVNGPPSDDFSVDELLDFSNGDGFVEEEGEGEERVVEEGEQSNGKASVSGFCEMDDFPAVPAGELTVPADDAADLEWLSHFVEDSFSEYSAPFPAGLLPEKPRNGLGSEGRAGPERLCFTTPVPAKARSKRARTGGRVWSLGSTPSLSESSGTTSSSSTSTTSCSSHSPWLIATNFGLIDPVYGKPPAAAKKPKRRLKQPGKGTGPGSGQAVPPRRCSHCGVQKTPQWRAGPYGAKTLCNACGVRFKSGRLLPEYRPACSPTFSSELHSNHHRKVLEMRRKKEDVPGQPEPGLAVPSF